MGEGCSNSGVESGNRPTLISGRAWRVESVVGELG
jgi:hypothetical protein